MSLIAKWHYAAYAGKLAFISGIINSKSEKKRLDQ